MSCSNKIFKYCFFYLVEPKRKVILVNIMTSRSVKYVSETLVKIKFYNIKTE